MLEVVVTVEGEKQFSRRLGIVADGISDWRKPLFRIGGELRGSIDQNFSARGAMFGSWAPRTRPYAWPLLEKTSRMRKGFRQTLTNDELVVFNIMPYFKYHQSRLPRSRLPRRVMMKIDRIRQQFIQKQFQQHVTEVIRESGRG